MNDNKKYLRGLKQELNQYKRKLSAATDSFKGKAGEEGDKILTSLGEILKEASLVYKKLEIASAEEWEPLKKIASQSFEDLKNAFEDLKNSTSAQVREYASQLEECSHATFESSIEYITKNPLSSVLVAAGLGFVVGRLLK